MTGASTFVCYRSGLLLTPPPFVRTLLLGEAVGREAPGAASEWCVFVHVCTCVMCILTVHLRVLVM